MSKKTFMILCVLLVNILCVNANWFETTSTVYNIKGDTNDDENCVDYFTLKKLLDIDETHYDDSHKMTRFEVADIISDMIDEKYGYETKESFDDVDSEMFYVISPLIKKGIIYGYDNKFRPNDKITYEEALAIVSRYKNSNSKWLMSNDAVPIFEDNGLIYSYKDGWIVEFNESMEIIRKIVETEKPDFIMVHNKIMYFRVQTSKVQDLNSLYIYDLEQNTFCKNISNQYGRLCLSDIGLVNISSSGLNRMAVNKINVDTAECTRIFVLDINEKNQTYIEMMGNFLFYNRDNVIYKMSLEGTVLDKYTVATEKFWMVTDENNVYVYFMDLSQNKEHLIILDFDFNVIKNYEWYDENPYKVDISIGLPGVYKDYFYFGEYRVSKETGIIDKLSSVLLGCEPMEGFSSYIPLYTKDSLFLINPYTKEPTYRFYQDKDDEMKSVVLSG